MSVGLFLDVDNTLTVGLIQERFAELLDVEEAHQKIERAFQAGTLSSDGFGHELIRLFNQAGFTKEFAARNFDQVKLTAWARKLMKRPASTYLVSSGPSYYVRPLADKFGIPKENVLCSEYEFGLDGKLRGCEAVSGQMKADFVRERKNAHILTIGVGDVESHDGPFLNACDVSILTTPASDYLYAENLALVETLVSRLSARNGPAPRERPNLFIGSSSEYKRFANALHTALESECRPYVWDTIFTPSRTTIETLEEKVGDFDFAAFIMTPDDVRNMRGQTAPAIRDNLIFELGLFMGRIGRRRCFILHPNQDRPELPSDLRGVVYLEYDAERPEGEEQQALNTPASKIAAVIRELGSRKPGL